MASSSLYDAAGSVREKSSLVMDLGKLSLLNPNSSSALKQKGKSVTTIQQPVSFAPTADKTSAPQSLVVVPSMVSTASSVPLALLPLSGVGAASVPEISMPIVNSAPVLLNSTTHGTSLDESTSWSKIVSTSTPQLSFVQPIFNSDCSALCILPGLLAIGRKKYQLCLIEQFVGNAPKIGLIHAILNKLWGRDGSISIFAYKDGLFLFQFPNEAAYTRALSRGPWHIKLKHVPLELLTKEGLSYLASTLGTPLYADQDCSKIFKSDCANVCVQVNFSKPLLNELKLDINGENVVIDVVYSWKSAFCEFCKNWSHHTVACAVKKLEKKWVPEPSPVVSAPIPVESDLDHLLNAFIDAPTAVENLNVKHSVSSVSVRPEISSVSNESTVASIPVESVAIETCISGSVHHSESIPASLSSNEISPSVLELPSVPRPYYSISTQLKFSTKKSTHLNHHNLKNRRPSHSPPSQIHQEGLLQGCLHLKVTRRHLRRRGRGGSGSNKLDPFPEQPSNAGVGVEKEAEAPRGV
ncbi:hypothetical protein Tsubulata_025849 [Turnera subulata]|uniref:DUF4283 domain-containing protein n=1 Tax=Turnera subulata TaxID=218843 RepID=A0A9Q0J2B5_9ROSI|nr:hypothetical protein Tsubulata_025849 [Turnera subulata]